MPRIQAKALKAAIEHDAIIDLRDLPDELKGDPRLQGSDKADHTDQINDYAFDLGGPILKDKLWFYGSYGKNDIRVRRLNQTADKTLLKNYSAKLNWQAGGSDMVSAFWFFGAKEKILECKAAYGYWKCVPRGDTLVPFLQRLCGTRAVVRALVAEFGSLARAAAV